MTNSAAAGGIAPTREEGPGRRNFDTDAAAWAKLDRKIAEVYAFQKTPEYRHRLAQEWERRRLAGTVLDPGFERRHRLHYTAGRIMRQLEERERPDGTTARHYRYRVTLCNRKRTEEGLAHGITVKTSPDGLHADFHGVQHCGSVWHCPMCSPKIARRRVREVLHAMKRHQSPPEVTGPAAGTGAESREPGELLFLTLTYQHGSEEAGRGLLAEALERFTQARRDLTGSGSYRRALEQLGYLGGIRALESTFGEMNGWHVHSHEIMFFAGGLPYLELLERVRRLRRIWARLLIKNGMAGLGVNDTPAERRKKLRDLLRHCFVIQAGPLAAGQYLLKFGKEPEQQRGGTWGPASELARSHLKRGGSRHAEKDDASWGLPARCDHASPWELLNDATDGDERSAVLFREFGEAFHGRRQLYWSKGLKERFGVAEIDDDDIAREPDARCTVFCGVLNDDQWRSVVRHRAHAMVKRVAARDGRDAMYAYIDSLDALEPVTARASPAAWFVTAP